MAPRGEGFGLVDRRGAFVQYAPRQDTPSDSPTNPAEPTTPTETPPVDTPTSESTPTPTPTPTPTTDTPPSTPTNNNSESKPNNSHSQSQPNNNTPTNSPNNNTPISTWTLTTSTSTNADGGVVVITQTIQATITPSNNTPSPTATETKSAGMSTGTITGIAIAGAIAGVAVIGFIVWKWMAGRKRMAEFDSDEIKWPELKEESHALPARPTGRHGAGLDGEDDRTDAMSSAYGPSTINTGPYGHAHHESVSQLLPAGAAVSYAASQPGYAPTQLSHGYSDSVTSGGVYHDPYAAPPHPGMSMSPAPMSMSPAPMSMTPAPGMIPARQQSPGPAVAYGGYDAAGRMSPGPAMAYGGPPPGGPPPAQYPVQYGGGYDTGRRSPGPNGAYGMS